MLRVNFDDEYQTSSLRLKRMRNWKGLSQKQLALEIQEKYGVHVSKAAILKYENSGDAVKGMSAEKLLCFADYFGVSTDWLLGGF